MITLTLPITVKTVLGGVDTVTYERLVVSHIEVDPVGKTITGSARLTSTSTPAQQAINGSFAASVDGLFLDLQVPQIGFFKRITLTGPQATGLQNNINSIQNTVESAFGTLGVVAGVQATGV